MADVQYVKAFLLDERFQAMGVFVRWAFLFDGVNAFAEGRGRQAATCVAEE